MASALLLLCFRLCPLLLGLGHAYFEARAASEYVEPAGGQRFSVLWFASALTFFLFELAAIGAAFRHPVPSLLAAFASGCGIALAVAGIHLRVRAIEELKAAFNRPPWAAQEPTVAREGVFAMVRHPSELGLALLALGLTLASGSLAVAALLGLLLFPLMALRIFQEEAWLTANTQGAYLQYAAAVPCILPFRLPWRRANGGEVP